MHHWAFARLVARVVGGLWCSWASAFGATVVLNEINYHPPSDLEDEEFVELWNYGATTVDLSGWAFTRGISFTFSAGTTLGPNAYIVVAKNPATLTPLAPGARIVGPWIGNLSNSGERVRLADNGGVTVDEVRYHGGPPWPTTADGRGSSLERICPSAPTDDPANWTAATGAAGGRQRLICRRSPRERRGVPRWRKAFGRCDARRSGGLWLSGTGCAG